MLVVAVVEKSQRNRFMLESLARQRYDRDKLQTRGLSSILSRINYGQSNGTIRLPFAILERVVKYMRELDKVVKFRFERELKVARWLAYHRLFALGAQLSYNSMDDRLIGFHKTITVDRLISIVHRVEHDLYIGTYLRLTKMLFPDEVVDGRMRYVGRWRVANRFNHKTNSHNDIGYLNFTEADNGIDYEGVVVCVYSKLPMETPDRQMRDYNRQYDVVIMGKSPRYEYHEWDRLYWPFKEMVIGQRFMEPGSSSSEEGDDDDALLSDSDNSSAVVARMVREELAADNSGGAVMMNLYSAIIRSS